MSIYDITYIDGEGTTKSFADFKNKVVLVVNTATKCGFTPQYEDLKNLYNKYSDKGLEILDFPCNQFGEQAPGSLEEISSFCTLNYGTPYKICQKVEVNGENETELYKFLKSEKTFKGFNNENHKLSSILHDMLSKNDPNYAEKSDIKWNFTKFLIDKNGVVVNRFEPVEEMSVVEEEIIKLLA